MKLLVLTLFCLICSSYIGDAADFRQAGMSEDLTATFSDKCSEHTIDSPEQNILLPRQTNLASTVHVRTVAKRNITQRHQSRYIFFISGKAVDKTFVETYQLLFRHSSSGLMTPFRHHLSLGRLII